ncbi:AraC family transcriptional regulator [Hugenholtzia roseola]|uniref:AraC family transcriptional regulator n=1 Tax=Hugenholtzia roseola TaxID=1002 RepID=UPI00041366E6|nr:AraC family transcriptional regulator [Hugenholtzia roseola]
MEDYNKIVESLIIRHEYSAKSSVNAPIHVENIYDINNSVILVHKGSIFFGEKKQVVESGEVLFIPAGWNLSNLILGTGTEVKHVSQEEFYAQKEQYLTPYQEEQAGQVVISWIVFDAKVYDSINFFKSLDLPAFVLKDDILKHDIELLVEERAQTRVGKERLTNILIEKINLAILRYIIGNKLFVERIATNSTYFLDPRLMQMFNYIKENLADDLSNKVLATIAGVSEDYVGQYFKMLTGMNPQDYIEYQRMEEAVKLLRTSRKSIRAIGIEIGYKDTAYFCRRFKMMFGVPAGKMRKRSSLMNVKRNTRVEADQM